jgi:hypothetical protein
MGGSDLCGIATSCWHTSPIGIDIDNGSMPSCRLWSLVNITREQSSGAKVELSVVRFVNIDVEATALRLVNLLLSIQILTTDASSADNSISHGQDVD